MLLEISTNKNIKKNFVNFHNNLGIQLLYIETVDAARNEFNQVLKVDPLNQNATRHLVECEVFSEAINKSCDPAIVGTKLTKLQEENKKYPLIYLYLGDFYFNIDQLKNAGEYYNKSINLSNGSVAAAYIGLRLIETKKQRPDLALEWFMKAVVISKWNRIYRNYLAEAYYEAKDYKNATLWYFDTVTLSSAYLDAYIGLSNSLRCLGEFKDASKSQEQQIKIMEQNDTKDLTINQVPTMYPINQNEPVYLITYDEKKILFLL